MKRWQDHIAQLKALMEILTHELFPLWDKDSLKEKRCQLQSIEKSISQLQKSNTPIPDELRELKFKLVKEIDEFSEGASAKIEIQTLMSPFLPQARKQKRKKTVVTKATIQKQEEPESRITLRQLIEGKVLPVPMVLTKKYKGKPFKSTITFKGTIELSINGELTIHESPSSAAVAASGKSQNGWTWWNIEGQSSERTLEYYR